MHWWKDRLFRGKEKLVCIQTSNEWLTAKRKNTEIPLLLYSFLRAHAFPQQEVQANSQVSPRPSLVFWTKRASAKPSSSVVLEARSLNPFFRSPNLKVSGNLPKTRLPSGPVGTLLSFLPALGTEMRISSESIRIVFVSAGSALRWIKNRVWVSFREAASWPRAVYQRKVGSRLERM